MYNFIFEYFINFFIREFCNGYKYGSSFSLILKFVKDKFKFVAYYILIIEII